MKGKNGITLVALVITIVVLLILSAVTLASLQDVNFLGMSKEAKEKYNNSVEDEEKTLEQYLAVIPGGSARYYRVVGKRDYGVLGISNEGIYIYDNSGNYLSETKMEEEGFVIAELTNSSIKVKYNGKIYNCSTIIGKAAQKGDEGIFFETSKGNVSTTDPIFITDDGETIIIDPSSYYMGVSDEKVVNEIKDKDIAILDTSFNPEN